MGFVGDGSSVDIPIWVPDDDTPYDVQAMLTMQANTVVTQIKRIRNRMRSHVLFTDLFEPTANWDVSLQKVRIIGEVWAYFQLQLVRKTSALVVPSDGNLQNAHLGTLAPRAVPESQADLSSGSSGRLAAGYVLNSGEVLLAAMNSGSDIAVGATLSLGGGWPLDDFYDSEAS